MSLVRQDESGRLGGRSGAGVELGASPSPVAAAYGGERRDGFRPCSRLPNWIAVTSNDIIVADSVEGKPLSTLRDRCDHRPDESAVRARSDAGTHRGRSSSGVEMRSGIWTLDKCASEGWLAVVVLVACGITQAITALAQVGAGEITGIVNDQAGAAVPGVTITVTNVATNRRSVVASSGEGVYTAPSLPPGRVSDRRRADRVQANPPGRRHPRDRREGPARLHARRRRRARAGDGRPPTHRILRVETASLGTVVEQRAGRPAAAERPHLHHAWRRWRRASPCRPTRSCRASTAAGRAPTSICSTASRCCSPNRDRSRTFRSSTRFRSSRSRATARRPSSAASTAA